MSLKDKFWKSFRFFNLKPTQLQNKIIGVKPIIVANKNFTKDIFKIDNNKFCIPKGGPGIILKINKYSNEEFFMYLFIFDEYL